MNRKTYIATGVAILGLFCFCLVGALMIAPYILRMTQTVRLQQIDLDQLKPVLGTQPPDFTEAEAALSAQVGSYVLDKNTIRPLDEFYGLHTDDDAYLGKYNGPQGEVDLILIRTRSAGAALDYISIFKDWLHDNQFTSYQAIIDEDKKSFVLYDVVIDEEDFPERYGQAWASQEWVIKIESDSRTASDTFFEALPYR